MNLFKYRLQTLAPCDTLPHLTAILNLPGISEEDIAAFNAVLYSDPNARVLFLIGSSLLPHNNLPEEYPDFSHCTPRIEFVSFRSTDQEFEIQLLTQHDWQMPPGWTSFQIDGRWAKILER
jgi:hypothetical protein